MEFKRVEETKMSTRGQIVIPKGMREYIKADKDTVFLVIPIDKETIVLKKSDKLKLLNEFRKIRKSIKNKRSKREIEEEIAKTRKG